MYLPTFPEFDDTVLIEQYDAEESETFDDDPVAAIHAWVAAKSAYDAARPAAKAVGHSLNDRIRINSLQTYSEILDELFANPANAAEICEKWKQAVLRGV